MKLEDGIDSFSIHVNKNKSIRSNLWYFFKLIMFTIIISISLTLLLVFCMYFRKFSLMNLMISLDKIMNH